MSTFPVNPIGTRPLLPGTLRNLFYPPEKNEYTYFKLAASFPFAGGSNLVRAAWAADAAMLAYARYGETPMSPAELSECLGNGGLRLDALIGNWDANGTQGYFATNDNFALLAFRGTEKDDPVDEIDDADLFLVPESDHRPSALHPGPALFHLSRVVQLLSLDPCLVHRGFQRALDRVWNRVHEVVTAYRSSHPAAEICITGHSLGAALATLAFSRLADAKLSLITMGCPRVGNTAFRTRVLQNQSAAGIQRFVNHDDPVAHIPLEGAFYRHAPDGSLRFDGNGVLTQDDGSFKGDVAALRVAIAGLPADFSAGLATIDAPIGVVDHSPARYCVRLWNCCAS